MSSSEIDKLKRALKREKAARKAAEKILENKSADLFKLSQELKESNTKLQKLVKNKSSELQGVFDNIVDAYIVMDLMGNVIKMNNAAIELFGFNCEEEEVNLLKLSDPKEADRIADGFDFLMSNGSITNFVVTIKTKSAHLRQVHVNGSLVYDENGFPIAAQGIVRDITEEIELKTLLEDQKDKLSIVIDNSPIGISLFRLGDSGLLIANKALRDMLGYSYQEFSKIQVKDITHPDDIAISELNMKKLSKGEIDSFAIEKRYIKKNGNTLWAKTTVTAVRDKNKDIRFQVAIIEDVTQERLAKEQLKESEKRLSTLITNLDTGVLLENEKREIILTNNKFCETFKIPVSPEAMIGMDCKGAAEQSKMLFENPEEFVSRVNELVHNKKEVLGDELKMVNGTILERDYIPIFRNKEYKGHLWSYKDVTLRRRYRLSLEAQKQKYSSIIANMNLGLVEVDNDDTILMVNQSFCEMSGYASEELIGKKGGQLLMSGNYSSKIIEENAKRLNGQSNSYEVEILTKKGQKRHWLISGAPNYDLNGEVIGSIGIHLDITDLKNLQLQKERLLKKLEKNNEELQEYAHIVSHDLKSPLRSIHALTSWIKQDNHDKLDGSGKKNLGLIETTLEKMEQLIEDIYNYSSAGADLSKPEQVNLNQLVNNIISMLYVPSHIKIQVVNKLPSVSVHKTKIQQVFQNLITNAIKFIDKKEGLIEIGVKEAETHFIFSIKDNGIGIEKKYFDKIFKLFSRLNDNKDSTGIGLSIVKKIVDLHEGDIWLESTPTIGTVFYFTINKNL